MHRYAIAVLCVLFSLNTVAHGQSAGIIPLHVLPGNILSFHLQTRLDPDGGNDLDALPKGTILKIKMLDAVDSSTNRDGSEFRGVVVSSVSSEKDVVVHEDSGARILLVLLRSRNHPEGFRYELLLTHVNDHGKSFDLTASLDTSLSDGNPHSTTSAPSPAAAGPMPMQVTTQ